MSRQPTLQPAATQQAERDFLWPQLRELPYFRAMLRAVEASFYQGYELPAPIYDLGAGDGHFASLAFDFQIDVGLDPWQRPLREAAQRGAHGGLVQADGAFAPFPDNTFASALSNSVLEHIEHIDAVLADTARVLRPGALFLFCVPNAGYLDELSVPAVLRKLGLRRLAEVYRDWFRRVSRVFHADPPGVWQSRLQAAGFELEAWWHYFPPAAMRALEWGHYFGLPSLVAKWLTGRWVIAPRRWNLALTERLVRRYASSEQHLKGTFTWFVARKL